MATYEEVCKREGKKIKKKNQYTAKNKYDWQFYIDNNLKNKEVCKRKGKKIKKKNQYTAKNEYDWPFCIYNWKNNKEYIRLPIEYVYVFTKINVNSFIININIYLMVEYSKRIYHLKKKGKLNKINIEKSKVFNYPKKWFTEKYHNNSLRLQNEIKKMVNLNMITLLDEGLKDIKIKYNNNIMDWNITQDLKNKLKEL